MKKKISIFITILALSFSFVAFIPTEWDTCLIESHSEPWSWAQTWWGYCDGPNEFFYIGGCNVNFVGTCMHKECDTENPVCEETLWEF